MRGSAFSGEGESEDEGRGFGFAGAGEVIGFSASWAWAVGMGLEAKWLSAATMQHQDALFIAYSNAPMLFLTYLYLGGLTLDCSVNPTASM
ncbi:hypothetical protein FCV25MIE_12718 [Fagus crenata]